MPSKRGRPKKSESRRRSARIVLRVEPGVKAGLAQAARRRGHTLSREIEQRVALYEEFEQRAERTVEVFGGGETYGFAWLVAQAIQRIEGFSGAKWFQREDTHKAVIEAVLALLSWIDPSENRVYDLQPSIPKAAARGAVHDVLEARELPPQNRLLPDGAQLVHGLEEISAPYVRNRLGILADRLRHVPPMGMLIQRTFTHEGPGTTRVPMFEVKGEEK